MTDHEQNMLDTSDDDDSYDRVKIGYKLLITQLPPDTAECSAKLATVLQAIIDARLLWPVWMIDELDTTWISIDFQSENGELEYHTFRLDWDGLEIYKKIEVDDTYQILVEKKDK